MNNNQSQNIHIASKEDNHGNPYYNGEQQGDQAFVNTVRNHFDEFDRLKSNQPGPATVAATEEDNSANTKQDESNNKKLIERQKKADLHRMLVSHSVKTMISDTQPNNHMVSLLARDIDIPSTMKEFIAKMLDDMLHKLTDVWNSNSLPTYFHTEKYSSETNGTEIEVEVCTTKREITFWEKTKSTSLKLVTLFLPSELLSDKNGCNSTLPYYNPKE